jgi:hypothetical protein
MSAARSATCLLNRCIGVAAVGHHRPEDETLKQDELGPTMKNKVALRKVRRETEITAPAPFRLNTGDRLMR